MTIHPGDTVVWRWLDREIRGMALEVHPERWEIISKGAYVVRNGTPEDPAVAIRHESGSLVLKLAHELEILA